MILLVLQLIWRFDKPHLMGLVFSEPLSTTQDLCSCDAPPSQQSDVVVFDRFLQRIDAAHAKIAFDQNFKDAVQVRVAVHDELSFRFADLRKAAVRPQRLLRRLEIRRVQHDAPTRVSVQVRHGDLLQQFAVRDDADLGADLFQLRQDVA